MAVVGHDNEKLQTLEHLRRIHIERLLARADEIVVPTTLSQECFRYVRVYVRLGKCVHVRLSYTHTGTVSLRGVTTMSLQTTTTEQQLLLSR